MKVFDDIEPLRNHIRASQLNGQRVGFVPTMGALHPGHISLLRRAQESCSVVVASIFVNPTQFNNPEDLRLYPRILENDLELLSAHGCDAVFTPSEAVVYPGGRTVSHWDFGTISHVLEAHYRPGHFDGVLTVVKLLFEMTEPSMAFFGEKDFQQLSLIQHMVRQEQLPVTVVPCPTVREADGLAMSSRNLRLSSVQRQNAGQIYQVLRAMSADRERFSPSEVREKALHSLRRSEGLITEYLEIVDADSFESLNDWADGNPIALAAVYCDAVRLIDNMRL